MQKKPIADSQPRKYKINEYLLTLPFSDHRKAVQIIPALLGISINTFHNYRNILFNASQDIPHEKVVMFEKLFEMRSGELLNKSIHLRALKELISRERFNLQAKEK